jgi:hypothetical protein
MNNTSFKVKHNTLNYKVLLFLFDTSKKYNFFLQEKRVKSIIGVLLLKETNSIHIINQIVVNVGKSSKPVVQNRKEKH